MITGATRNTGYAIARRFARDGYDVALTSRSLSGAQEAARRLQEEFPGRRFLPLGMNPARAEEIGAAFDRVRETFGILHVFVGNAADLAVDCNVFDTTLERWNEVLASNVTANFLCAQRCAPV